VMTKCVRACVCVCLCVSTFVWGSNKIIRLYVLLCVCVCTDREHVCVCVCVCVFSRLYINDWQRFTSSASVRRMREEKAERLSRACDLRQEAKRPRSRSSSGWHLQVRLQGLVRLCVFVCIQKSVILSELAEATQQEPSYRHFRVRCLKNQPTQFISWCFLFLHIYLRTHTQQYRR
jgi:hypothetical protein